MSLAFSRRSFLKHSAVAAVAVAGASLFTGCESTGDSYNLVRDGAGTLTILQIQTDLGTYSDKDKKFVLDAPKVGATSFVFPLKITNGRTNALPVNPGNFKVTFTSADGKTVKKYIGTDLVVDNSLRETNLKKGSSVSGNVTVSDLPSLAKGDVVLLTYTPDPVYAEYSVNWKFVTVE